MDRNYDSSQVGVEYIRIPRIQIHYPAPLTATIEASEVTAVQMADGSVKAWNDTTRQMPSISVGASDMATEFPLRDPTSGAEIPGATMTVQQLMVGIMSYLRMHQLARDFAEANPPAPEPAPDPGV